jgi:Carboxypeptidase regulatory-like domain
MIIYKSSIKFLLLIIIKIFILKNVLIAQSSAYTQTIKGMIRDADSKAVLEGASIILLKSSPSIGTTSDAEGHFRIENIPVGRHDLQITLLGYAPVVLSQIAVTSGKETFLNIDLNEKIEQLKEVVIQNNPSKSLTVNEMAHLSARSFSLEEANRYAATFSDPARMAQNFAGVTTNNDLGNEVIVRGNSPRGVLWRLEGIEIPNPNHFGNLGSSAGGITMLSGTALGQSDFYTGAFPAEYGNALAGVFDLKMRNGNTDKREYSAQLGIIGAEFNAEGYFKKGNRASYLLHYRYTTTGLLLTLLPSDIAGYIPKYQDFSAKINLPTQKAGIFSFFALGGDNLSARTALADSTKWQDSEANQNYREYNRMGVMGLSHLYFFNNNKMYLKTVVAATTLLGQLDNSYLDSSQHYALTPIYKADLKTNDIKLNTFLNYKISEKSTLRIGGDFSQTDYRLQYQRYKLKQWYIPFDNQGSTQFFQLYVQNKYHFDSKWTLHTGLHYSNLVLNHTDALEPRFALQYQATDKTKFGLSIGQHSRPEHISVYLLEQTLPNGQKVTPNRTLKMPKANHFVLSFDHNLGENWRIKLETYYQSLYNIGVETDSNRSFSMANLSNTWQLFNSNPLISNGKATNIGADLTLEKSFSNNYYFLMTGSIFDSKYSDVHGKWLNSVYNSNYALTVLGGGDYKFGKLNHKVLSFNGKFTIRGGNRYTPVDETESKRLKQEVLIESQRFEAQTVPYWRIDCSVWYQINKPHRTHTWTFELQNATNHLNIYYQYFDNQSFTIKNAYHIGILPNLNYKIEF